jgi:tRNA nucleotidyltransferase (CCA-adding enzyme)
MPARMQELVLAAASLWHDLPKLSGASPSQVAARLDAIPPVALYAVYRATSDIHLRRQLQMYNTLWRQVVPATNGNALKALGLPPGPAYREILDRLRQAWLDGEIQSEMEEKTLLKQLLENYGQE